MRASLTTGRIALRPGRAARVSVEVTNTGGVIDGVSVGIRPTPGLLVTSDPPLLALFPDATGYTTLELTPDRHFAAGEHTLEVEVVSAVAPGRAVTIPLLAEVEPAPAAVLRIEPSLRRARRRARYRVIARNEGNTVLPLDLAAADDARALRTRLGQPVLTIPPGGEEATELVVTGRRHLFGVELRHRVAVVGQAGPLTADTSAGFRQLPVIPRGARTFTMLGLIVALWAAVFLVALTRSMSGDPLTKQVPPSFYAAMSQPVNTASFGVLGHSALLAGDSTGATPAGAVPKAGVVIGVGGTIDGTIVAASTSAGVGRITVQAVRDSASGPVLVSSAATASDGSYALVGLLPGQYKLHLVAAGYADQWYPDVTSEQSATPVTVNSEGSTDGVNATVTGQPATISGTVATGQTPAPPVTVTVTSTSGPSAPPVTVTTDASGTYLVSGLAAPGVYDLSFTSAGYQVASDTEEVAAGEAHIANPVTLLAGNGSLGGTVTDGKDPLGGVTITATANGRTVTSATPTTGAVGRWSIPGLATPGTYLLTFSKEGYGTYSVAEELGPGRSQNDLVVPLVGGAGQISGTVTGPGGQPVGGVTVTVDGANPPASTATLTAGSVGSYLLSGLATPGNYTLTFSAAGFGSQTVAVPLTSGGSATGVDVTLAPATGTITGSVTSSTGAALTGATVTVTDGQTPRTTTSASSPPGGWTVAGLPPGSYSVTFALAGFQARTVLVHLSGGQTATADATLTAGS